MMRIPQHSGTAHAGKNTGLEGQTRAQYSYWILDSGYPLPIMLMLMRIPQHSGTVHAGKNTGLEGQTRAHLPTGDQDPAAEPFLVYDDSDDHTAIV